MFSVHSMRTRLNTTFRRPKGAAHVNQIARARPDCGFAPRSRRACPRCALTCGARCYALPSPRSRGSEYGTTLVKHATVFLWVAGGAEQAATARQALFTLIFAERPGRSPSLS